MSAATDKRPPHGSTVSTVVHGIGGRSETVSGEVVGYRRGCVLLKTACHGTLAVPLEKITSAGEQPETSRTAPQEGDSERFHEYVERRLAGYDRRQVSQLPTHQELVRRGARYCSSCGTDEAMPGHEC